MKCCLDQHTLRVESCQLSANEEFQLNVWAWTQDIKLYKSIQESLYRIYLYVVSKVS